MEAGACVRCSGWPGWLAGCPSTRRPPDRARLRGLDQKSGQLIAVKEVWSLLMHAPDKSHREIPGAHRAHRTL